MLRAIIGGLATTGILFSVPALAQDEQRNQNTAVTVLDTVVVTAGRSEEQLKSLSVPVTVITEKDIERTGAQTLPDLLRQQGVNITELGHDSGTASVTMRGLSTNRNPLESGTVLILMDGRRIGSSNISHIPLQNIGRVEIIRGAASAQYGSEASGGVINLISKRGGETFTAFMEQTIGSWERNKTQAGFSGQVGAVDFSLGGSYYESGAYEAGDGQGRATTRGVPERWLGGLNVGYNFNEDHRLGLVANISKGEYSSTMSKTQLDAQTDRTIGFNNRKLHSWDLRYDGALPDSNLTWMARYFQGEDYYQNSTSPTSIFDYTGKFKGASAVASWNNGLLYLTGGLDYYNMDYTKESLNNSPPPWAKQSDMAGFLLAKVALLDDSLWFNGGLRYDKFEVESGSDTRNSNPLRHVRGAKLEDSVWTPSVGVSYMPLEWLKLRATYSTSFKMPEPISQMGANPCSGSGTSYATGCIRYAENPDLGPEKSKSWELGTDVYYEGLTLGLTYFNIDYKDKIESVHLYDEANPHAARPNPRQVRMYRNLAGTTEYRGLEANFEWQMGETFNWSFEFKPYVNLTRMFRYHNVGENRKIHSVADLVCSYGLVFDDDELGLRASLDAVYSGHQNTTTTGTGQFQTFGGYTTVDLHLAKRIMDWQDKGRLILKADILNLGDKYYETGSLTSANGGYPGEGRSFMLGLRYEY